MAHGQRRLWRHVRVVAGGVRLWLLRSVGVEVSEPSHLWEGEVTEVVAVHISDRGRFRSERTKLELWWMTTIPAPSIVSPLAYILEDSRSVVDRPGAGVEVMTRPLTCKGVDVGASGEVTVSVQAIPRPRRRRWWGCVGAADWGGGGGQRVGRWSCWGVGELLCHGQGRR